MCIITGIGQILPINSKCNYYLDCPGVPVKPSIVNESVPDIIKNPVPEGGNIVKKTDVSEYGLGEDEFWNWIAQEEKDLGDDEWDVVESYKPDDKIV